MKASIRQIGVKVPVLVRWTGEEAVLVDGESRLRSCLELIAEGVPIKTIPVLQESLGDPAERLLLAISANTGKPLSLLESGGAFRRLQAYGWSVDDIAAKSGFKRSFVIDALELSCAPIEVKQMVQNGSVTPALAKKAVREKGDKAAADLIQKVEKAKAAGKTTAKRERTITEVKASINEMIEIGDEMYREASILPDDTPLGRAARKWAKARGL